MEHPELNRRDFHRLTMAALGGVVAGTMSGCGDDKKPAGTGTTPGGSGAGTPPPARSDGKDVAEVKGDPHACRGLNACKGQGADGKNDCAGQGECATKTWYHSCHGQNDCKGQGGCGESATQNDCKTKGECSIPLMSSAWKSARKHFEEKMKEDKKDFGEAPVKKKS